jgi:large repetitive protein
MTALDLRAQRAVSGIRSSVAASPATPVMDLRGAARMRFMTHATMGIAAAAAVAATFVILGSVIQMPTPSPAPPAGSGTTTTTVAPPTTSTPPSTTEVPVPIPPPPSTTTPTTTSSTTTTTTSTTVPPDTTPPAFEILSPEHNQTFEVKVVTFSGTVEPGATVFAGRYEATVTDGGEWSIALTLSPGRNSATLVATDAAGNQTSATVVVFLEVPKEDPPVDWEFTANRVNGSSTKNPPYDVYWGTGKPGTVIEIVSEFGSGSVEVDAEGGWEVKVTFPTAPANEEFVVKVKDFTGAKFTFGFMYVVT